MSRFLKILAMLGIGFGAACSSTGIERTAQSTKHWDATPDAPQSFGYKVSWLTIRTQDAVAVIKTLGLTDTRPANWQTGISTAYEREGHQVFVSPPVNGWTFVVGFNLPALDQSVRPGDPVGGRTFGHMFARLTEQFPDVQFFGSYRVVGYAAWARARRGHVERVFSWADGTVYVNFGRQSAEEHALGFVDISGLTPEAAGDALHAAADKRNKEEESLVKAGVPPKEALKRMEQAVRYPLPDEQDVVDLAKAWSGIDPTQLEQGHFEKGSGTVGILPADGDLNTR